MRPVVLLLGPGREAISGVTTHLNLLFGSRLAAEFSLEHFQIGSQGRRESRLGRWRRLAASPFRLFAACLRAGAAIVHINTSLNPGAYWRDLFYVAAAKLAGARVVYQVHGGALPREFLPGRLGAAWLRWTLSWPDAVVLLAKCELAAYRAFRPGLDPALVPNGIDAGPYLRASRPAAEPGAPLRLAFVGRLDRAKGLFESVDALARLAARGVAARLIIAGSGPDEAPLRARVRELGLKREVTFVGPLDAEQKVRLLGLTDVFLLPSYTEGLPYSLLEAMAAGAVPLVTAVGAMPDVVREGEHGLIVPQSDPEAIAAAAAALAADRAALARMSAACRERIATAYSIDRVRAELRGIYRNLLKRHVRHRRLGRSAT